MQSHEMLVCGKLATLYVDILVLGFGEVFSQASTGVSLVLSLGLERPCQVAQSWPWPAKRHVLHVPFVPRSVCVMN